MKRALIVFGTCLPILCLAAFSLAADGEAKPGKLTGSWEGTATSAQQGEFPITMELEQNGEAVSGSISAPEGTAEISSGTFKENKLEFRVDAPEATYTVTGSLRKGELSGEWSSDTGEKGTWQVKKKVEPKS
jgi:hypothetical protein